MPSWRQSESPAAHKVHPPERYPMGVRSAHGAWCLSRNEVPCPLLLQTYARSPFSVAMSEVILDPLDGAERWPAVLLDIAALLTGVVL